MRKLLLFISLWLVGLTWAQTENSWQKKASFGGLKREKAVAFSIGNHGYVGCGVDTAEMVHNDLWQYDPEMDTWTQVASLPGVERRNAVAFVAGDLGYVGTGMDNDNAELGNKLNDFWAYDPVDNAWLAKANYPGGGDTGIYQATAFAIADKGYVTCGKIGSDAYITELWEYTPETDSWVQRTPFPGGDRYQLISFVLENKAYVGLGTDHDIFRRDLWEYDPVVNSWSAKPDFPGSERAQSSSFSIGSKGFVVFGSDGGTKDELWEYSYYTESWAIRAPFPGGGRRHAIAFSIGNTGYAGLGKGESGKKRSFYAYTPAGPLGIESEDEIRLSVYPNPATSHINVNLPEQLTKGYCALITPNGKVVYHRQCTTTQLTIERKKNWTRGTYYLLLLDEQLTPVATQPIQFL